jgi:hypothetical protein
VDSNRTTELARKCKRPDKGETEQKDERRKDSDDTRAAEESGLGKGNC